MRLLLTWADRSAGRTRGPRAARGRRPGPVDPGPLMRLLHASAEPYDAALVLTTRKARAGARALAIEMRQHIEQVEVRPLPVVDPSDYAELFAALGPVIGELPEAERVDVVLSAGTPQAQTLWVILVAAGLLDARMLQVIPPQFVPDPHPHPIREVQLDIDGFPEIRALRDELVRLRATVAAATADLVGDSPPMRRLAERIGRVAAVDVPVLILGETGTGKEHVARAIHAAGPRAGGPFVAENCGAFAEGVLASELFGHEAGAFTGATGRRRGLFEQADGGTLFLDEVGEMPPAVQVRLLRTLQEGTVRRVGAEQPIAVDVRIVAATHRDLPQMVAEGAFREDLYYRLRGAELRVPPLRDRMGDLEPLVVHGLRLAGRADLRPTRAAWAALQRWSWPGNVRELLAEVRRWTVFCDAVVELDDLAPEIAAGAPSQRLTARVIAPPSPTAPAIRPLAEQVEATERAAIEAALAHTGGNLSQAARLLAIDRNTLKRKLRRYALSPR